MSIYDDMQAIGRELLTEFNQDGISYVELIPAMGPPDNPGAPSETVHSLTGAVARGVEYKYVDGTQIVASDGQVTCKAPLSFTPKIKDWVIVGGQRHKIKSATAIPPTGTPVVYVWIYER